MTYNQNRDDSLTELAPESSCPICNREKSRPFGLRWTRESKTYKTVRARRKLKEWQTRTIRRQTPAKTNKNFKIRFNYHFFNFLFCRSRPDNISIIY